MKISYDEFMAGYNTPFYDWLKSVIEEEKKMLLNDLYNNGKFSRDITKVNYYRARIKSLDDLLKIVEDEKQNLSEEVENDGRQNGNE